MCDVLHIFMNSLFAVSILRSALTKQINAEFNSALKNSLLWRKDVPPTWTLPWQTSVRNIRTRTIPLQSTPKKTNGTETPRGTVWSPSNTSSRRILFKCKTVLKRVYRYLDTGYELVSAGILHKALNNGKIHGAARAKLYERAIIAFFLKGKHDQATKFAERMTSECYVPSKRLQTLLLTNNVILSKIDKDAFFLGMKAVFADLENEVEAEAVLAWTMVFLAHFKNPDVNILAEATMKAFIPFRMETYSLKPNIIASLVKFHVYSNSEKDATRWLDYHASKIANRRTRGEGARDDDAQPYTAYIQENLKIAPEPSVAYTAILKRMKNDGVLPDTSLINSLILAEAKSLRHTKAVRLYEVLRNGTKLTDLPNSTTYKLVFNSYRKLTSRQRDSLFIPIIPLRQLFYEMLDLQQRIEAGEFGDTKVKILSQENLNASVACFVETGDYSGAQIALGTFDYKQIRINSHTTPLILNTLTNRCFRELFSRKTRAYDITTRSRIQARQVFGWVDSFLSLRAGQRDPIKQSARPRDTILQRIKHIGTHTLTELNLTTHAEKFKPIRDVPRDSDSNRCSRQDTSHSRISPAHHADSEKTRTDQKLLARQTTLLLVLLIRAVHAQFGSPFPAETSISRDVIAARVKAEVDFAIKEMVPPKPDPKNTTSSEKEG